MNNFEKVYLQSTETEKIIGLQWYSDQHNYLKDMASHFDVPMELVCGITAVLSPSISWQSNVNLTYHVLKFKGKIPSNIKTPCYRINLKKAIKIYKKKRVFPTLSGPKVTQFYLNLLNPFDDNNITIDSFMIGCFYDISDRKNVGKHAGKKSIEFLKSEIKELAVKYDLLPLQFQAIVWISYHRIVKSMASYNSQLTLKIF
jgi:hypothetical protein